MGVLEVSGAQEESDPLVIALARITAGQQSITSCRNMSNGEMLQVMLDARASSLG